MSTRQGLSESGTAELVFTSKTEQQLITNFISEVRELGAQQNLLFVTNRLSPDETFASIRTGVDTVPEEWGIIGVGEEVRSTTADSSIQPPLAPIMTVSREGVFTQLGTAINLYLSEWADNPYQTRICFSPLTTLVDQGELRQVFKLIHLLSHRIKATGATAKFYLDRQACSNDTVRKVIPLFDVVTNQQNADASSTTPDSSFQAMVEEVLDIQRCRQTIIYFMEENTENTPVEVSTIAEWIAEQGRKDEEERDNSDSVDQIHQSLHHVYIPKLVEAGLVVTDESHDQVEGTQTMERVVAELSSIGR